jgi:hypothetical protein
MGAMDVQQQNGAAWDRFAMGLSALCLLHCVAPPLLIALAPTTARLLGLPEWLHAAAVFLAVPSTAIAMRQGYRHHGAVFPALMGGAGLLLLAFGAFAHETEALEVGATMAGSALLVLAHLRNRALRRAGSRVSPSI